MTADNVSQPPMNRLKPDEQASVDAVKKLAEQCPRIPIAIRAYNEVSERCGADSEEAQKALQELQDMIATESERSKPAAMIIPLSSANDPRKHKPSREKLHGGVLAGGIYAGMVRKMIEQTWGKSDGLTNETIATAVQHGVDVDNSMKPRDALEKMLIEQALWTHARIAHLNDLAVGQQDRDALRIVNEAADRATNSFRRHMLALAEYRKPPRSDVFTAIKQANIGGQQVIQNLQQGKTENGSNEQGFLPNTAAALPPDARGIAVAAPQCPEGKALDTINRPANTRRKGPRAT